MKRPVISFVTLGCRLNQAEEESFRREALEAGFLISEPNNADLCIVNTCSVTSVADKKSHQAIRKIKSQNNTIKIVAIGCGAENSKVMPEVDLAVSNKDKTDIIKIVTSKLVPSDALRRSKPIQNKKKTINSYYRTRALLKIQDGCNNFCSYCIVAHLRGRETSVLVSEILKEAQKLDKMGYKELVLTGVNVGKYKSQYSGKIVDLTGLVKILLKKTDFPRIRLSSINPQDVTDDMIDLWAKEPRLCRHFHLSLQSGSTSVLKRMKRPYAAENYKILSNKIVQKIPEIAITTDVIVGFPGETEKEFNETKEFIKKANLAKIHTFRYSKRPGTLAYDMPRQVPEHIKKKRAGDIHQFTKGLEKSFKEKFIGQEMEVLFEDKKDGFWYGLTTNYIRIKYKSDRNLYNQIIKVKILAENLV